MSTYVAWYERMVLLYNVTLTLSCTVYIRTFNNWFICQRAFIEIWSTRKVWRARKMRENISRRCKRSCPRLVTKLIDEFMRVNELYLNTKFSNPKEKQRCCFNWLIYNRPYPSFVWQKVRLAKLKTPLPKKK